MLKDGLIILVNYRFDTNFFMYFTTRILVCNVYLKSIICTQIRKFHKCL